MNRQPEDVGDIDPASSLAMPPGAINPHPGGRLPMKGKLMDWFLKGLLFFVAAFVILTVITLIGAGLECLWRRFTDE